MDQDLVIFLVWAISLVVAFVVATACVCCFASARPPNEEAAAAPAAVHQTPPPAPGVAVGRILMLPLLELDKVTYPRRNALPASASGGGGGGGLPSTSASASVSEDCAICLGQFVDGDRCSVMPVCRHEFHRDCIASWLMACNDTCPLCRAKLQWSLVALDRHGIV